MMIVQMRKNELGHQAKNGTSVLICKEPALAKKMKMTDDEVPLPYRRSSEEDGTHLFASGSKDMRRVSMICKRRLDLGK